MSKRKRVLAMNLNYSDSFVLLVNAFSCKTLKYCKGCEFFEVLFWIVKIVKLNIGFEQIFYFFACKLFLKIRIKLYRTKVLLGKKVQVEFREFSPFQNVRLLENSDNFFRRLFLPVCQHLFQLLLMSCRFFYKHLICKHNRSLWTQTL